MNDLHKILITRKNRTRPHISRLKVLYASMDQAYLDAASHYGFICSGCEESCCRTRFYHFTFIEYLYLFEGYQTLGPAIRREVHQRALRYSRQMHDPNTDFLSLKEFCPINTDGACILYPWRPMICRLHGIPHELHTPGKPVFHGTGCAVFTQNCGNRPAISFDRTPFYQDLAALERTLRNEIGRDHGIKMTVAMMLLDFQKTLPRNSAASGAALEENHL